MYRFVNGVGRLALRGLGLDVRWSGDEHLPRTGPVVLAVTHVSYPDFVLVERAAVTRGRYVRFMTRHDVWEVPVVPWFMDRMRHIPVDRQAAGVHLPPRAPRARAPARPSAGSRRPGSATPTPCAR